MQFALKKKEKKIVISVLIGVIIGTQLCASEAQQTCVTELLYLIMEIHHPPPLITPDPLA